jgi:LPXTG-site transpeptidase (sortase) family protein
MQKSSRISKWTRRAGAGILALGVVLAFVVFFPSAWEEARYRFVTSRQDLTSKRVTLSPDAVSEEGSIVPVSGDFAIVIPKIGANAPVVADVDPYDEVAYRRALHDGIAHAMGTKYPGEPGNTFLFAHSSDDFITGGRYNAVFYLIGKLKPGDRFSIAYQGDLYEYRVFDTKTVPADDVKYLNALSEEHTVTLMTCWPAGTDYQRLLVFGVLESVTLGE